MTDLNKEAEEYAHNYFVMQDSHYNGLKEGYIAGATSNYVEQKIIEAQIEVYRTLLRRSDNHYSDICRYIYSQMENLLDTQSQLTTK